VRASLVVVGPPFFDDLPSVSEGQKPVLVQALVAEAPVEALDESVLLGLPGAMKRRWTPLSYAPTSSARLVSSGPLSIMIFAGLTPRSAITRSSTVATRAPRIDVSTSMASDSRVKTSSMVSKC